MTRTLVILIESEMDALTEQDMRRWFGGCCKVHRGAKVHQPGEHQIGFIAQDWDGRKGNLYCAVSLTDQGRQFLSGG